MSDFRQMWIGHEDKPLSREHVLEGAKRLKERVWRAGLLVVHDVVLDDEEIAAWDVTAGDGIEEEPMTLAVGNKIVKCDDEGQPVKNESYILFEIIELDYPDTEAQAKGEYKPRVTLKKLS